MLRGELPRMEPNARALATDPAVNQKRPRWRARCRTAGRSWRAADRLTCVMIALGVRRSRRGTGCAPAEGCTKTYRFARSTEGGAALGLAGISRSRDAGRRDLRRSRCRAGQRLCRPPCASEPLTAAAVVLVCSARGEIAAARARQATHPRLASQRCRPSTPRATACRRDTPGHVTRPDVRGAAGGQGRNAGCVDVLGPARRTAVANT